MLPSNGLAVIMSSDTSFSSQFTVGVPMQILLNSEWLHTNNVVIQKTLTMDQWQQDNKEQSGGSHVQQEYALRGYCNGDRSE